MTTDTHFPRAARLALGVAAGISIAIATPLAASAHIHVDPATASAGDTQTLTFAFSHGCDGSPTTGLAIDIPEGVGNATPVVQGGWTITRDLGPDGVPTRVTYTPDAPVENGLKATVSMDVLFTDDTADTTVAFPVTQTCVTGSTAWTEVADEGQTEDDLESPAPVVEVGAVAPDGGDHGHGSGDEAAADDGPDGAEHEAAATTSSAADPVARWLAAGGLAAGIAALIVVLVRGRRQA